MKKDLFKKPALYVLLFSLTLLLTACGQGKTLDTSSAEEKFKNSNTFDADGENADGKNGENEKDGKNGKNGKNGEDGKDDDSDKAKDGKDKKDKNGKNGKNGKNEKDGDGKNGDGDKSSDEKGGADNRIVPIYVTCEDGGFKIAADGEHKKLAKALDEFNKSSYPENGTAYVRRSDENYLSFVQYTASPINKGMGIKDNPYEYKTGWTFDVNTGKILELNDVIKDEDGFRKALEEVIFEYIDEDVYADDIKYLLDEKLFKGNFYDDGYPDDFAWTLGFEGIDIYLRTGGYIDGGTGNDREVAQFFIPYYRNEKLFTDKVLDVPYAYAQKIIVTEGRSDSVYIDDGSGYYSRTCITPEVEGNDYDIFKGFSVIGLTVREFEIEKTDKEPEVWYIRNDDGCTYLYVFDTFEGESMELTTYGFEKDNIERTYGETVAPETYINGLDIPVKLSVFDPTEFALTTTDPEGPDDYIRLAKVGSSGRPVPADREIKIIHPLSNENVKASKDSFTVIDYETEKEYYLDDKTVLCGTNKESLPCYEKGDDALSWMERYSTAEPGIDSGLAMGDLIETIVSGDHIDQINGVYWWD